MRPSVFQSRALPRALPLALLAVAVASATTGCHWFSKGPKGDYALSPEARPLEVPPDLNLPATDGAMRLPSVVSAPASKPQPTPATSATGFVVAGGKDDVFAKLGTALESVEGVSIASRAQLLGAYDLGYEGSNFLVRVTTVEAGTYVAAVDPRGLPATGAAPAKLIAELKAALAK